MQAANGILCRWSISVLGESNDARLTLLGTKGQLVATRNRTDETWIAGGAVQETFRGNEAAAEALAEIERVASSQPPVFSWREASRGQEVAEAIERSALRGKTVELFNEEHTEQGTFKGMMAVGSCGLLMLTLLILVVGAFIESVRLPLMRMQQRAESAEQLGGPNELGAERVPPVANEPFPLWIRLWPVYPLALFLALQLINVLFIRPAMQRKERQDHRESRG